MSPYTSGAAKLVLCLTILTQLGCHRSAQYYLDLANREFAEGKFADASINYRKSINSSPQNAEAHYRLALDEEKLTQYSEAYDEFTRATNLAPERDDMVVAQADLALISYSTNPRKPKVLYDKVADTANRLLAKNKNSFDGLRLSGDTLVLDGKLDGALELFRRAAAVRPLDPKVVLPMAQVLFRLNQGAEGERLAKNSIRAHPSDSSPLYDALLEHYVQANRAPEAEDLLRSEIAAMPKESKPRLQLAGIYHRAQLDAEMVSVLTGILHDSKAFPDGHALVGDFYESIGNTDEAVREYNQGITAQPKDRASYQKRIVRLLIGQGKRAEALQRLDAMLKENPSDTDSRSARAILLRQAADPRQREMAIADLNAILEGDRNNVVIRYNLGLAYLQSGDLKSARAQLSECARLAPAYLPARLALAELAQRNRNYGETIQLTNQVLAIDPANKAAKLWHAAGLLGNKNYQQAETELAALLKDDPDSVDVNLYMAALDSEQKKYGDAEAIFLRLYKPGQKDLRPLEGLVEQYLRQRQPDKALKTVDEALKQTPESSGLHMLLASTALRAGNLGVAEQQYEWVRSHDPNSAQAYVSLGDIYRLKGDAGLALSSYRKARELAPADEQITADIAFVESATGQRTDAIANLRKQLASNPDDTVALNNLAFELAESGADLEQASALAEKAQRKAPSDPGIADTLSWVYVRRGLNDSAIQILDGLIKKYPNQPEFRYHLGVALMQKGRIGDARTQFNLALSNNPPQAVADKIKQIMSKMG